MQPGCTNNIHVVGVGSDLTSELVNAFVSAAYCPEVMTVNDWLDISSRRMLPSAIAFYDGASLVNEIVTLLQRYTTPPVMCIFMRDMVAEDEAITRLCKDFLVWPWEQWEFSVRLNSMDLDGRLAQPWPEDKYHRTLTNLNLVGQSIAFTSVVELLRKISAYDAPILINGETGTGKEVAARAIHYLSERGDGPFIPADCGGLPDELLENELFGHRRGAYTGAQDSQLGLVEQADGGTLFLDEIGNLSPKGQCALLRFLQTQEFKRLGCDKLRKADVRVIAATNADLWKMVEMNEFREDLLYRLDVLSLTLPPLRDRDGDAQILAEHVLEKLCRQYGRYATLTPESLDWIKRYHWPGNVRELENLVRREYMLSDGGGISICSAHRNVREIPLSADVYSIQVERGFRQLGSLQQQKNELVRGFEKRYLAQLMEYTSGNVSEAARIAGKERRALGKLLKKYGINRQQFYKNA